MKQDNLIVKTPHFEIEMDSSILLKQAKLRDQNLCEEKIMYLRHWLIKKLAGKRVIVINATIVGQLVVDKLAKEGLIYNNSFRRNI